MMNRIIVAGGVAAAALLAPLAVAGTASAAPAPAPAKATGSVAWVVHDVAPYGDFTGTVVFSANNNTGGTLDMTNSIGYWLHGTVTPGTVKKDANTVTFDGTFAEGSAEYNGGTGYFHAKVVDGSTSGRDSDKIVVFVNEDFRPGVLADVTSGNLTVH